VEASSVPTGDALTILREYRALAPWNLRDLATVATAILDASNVRPINAAASTRPNERTIRFYVTRGLVTPPEGRGTAAIYGYRHLLEVLAIKLRQMEGATLAAITKEMRETTGDTMERRVAAAFGPGLLPPKRLALTRHDSAPRGRAGRALRAWAADETSVPNAEPTGRGDAALWSRFPVSAGVELHVHAGHPLTRGREQELADAVRLAVGRVLDRSPASSDTAPDGLDDKAPAR
jgi:DNA-binding transcriptional MerR regulator